MPVSRPPNAYICDRCWSRLTGYIFHQPQAIQHRFRPQLGNVRAYTLKTGNDQSSHSSPVSGSSVNAIQANTANITPGSDAGAVAKVGLEVEFPSPGQKKHEKSQEWKRRPGKLLLTKGWTSLLHEKLLGQSASVLVLRDSEEKRASRRPAEGTDSNGYTHDDRIVVEKILDSLKGQKLDPLQSEVNSGIEAVKPDVSIAPQGRSATVSAETHEHLLKELCKRFNETQLARYITTSSKPPTLLASVPLQSSAAARNGEVVISKSQWRPLGQRRRPINYRGKRALAETIFRSVWNLEVREEIEVKGTIDMRVPQQYLSVAMLGENHSVLARIGDSRNAKVEVHPDKSRITITAPKHACLDTVDDVETLLQSAYETDIESYKIKSLAREDARALWDNQGGGLRTIAEAFNCSITNIGRKGRIKVRARHAGAVENFHRILLSNIDFQARSQEILVSAWPDSEQGMVVRRSQGTLNDKDKTTHQDVGRFVVPYKVAKGIDGAPKGLPTHRKLPMSVREKVQEQVLRQPAFSGVKLPTPQNSPESSNTWEVIPQPHLSASYGHVLHPLDPGQIYKPSDLRHLSRLKPAPRSFAPSISGLPSALEALGLEEAGRKRSGLRIKFVPSPYKLSKTAAQGLPTLEMSLDVDPDTGLLEIVKLEALLGTRKAMLLLPHLGIDAEISRKDTLLFTEAGLNPALQKYVLEINSSNGRLVPIDLQIGIPRFTLTPELLRRDEHLRKAIDSGGPLGPLVEVDYLAVSYQHQNSLMYPCKSHELVYTRVTGDEMGQSWESVSLETKASIFPEGFAPDGAIEKSSSGLDAVRFMDDVWSVLRLLNIGLGNLHRMGAKKMQHEKAQQDSQPDYNGPKQQSSTDLFSNDITGLPAAESTDSVSPLTA